MPIFWKFVEDLYLQPKMCGDAVFKTFVRDVDDEILLYEKLLRYNVDGYSLRVRLPAGFSFIPEDVKIMNARVTRLFDGDLIVEVGDVYDYVPFKRGGSYKRGDRMCSNHGWFDYGYIRAGERAGKPTIRCPFCNRKMRM